MTLARHFRPIVLLCASLLAGSGCYSAGGYLRDHLTGTHLHWGVYDYQGHPPYTSAPDESLRSPQITID